MSKGKRATPENKLSQDCILRTRHLVDWDRNNVGVATFAGAKVRYGVGGVGGSDYVGVVRRTGQAIFVEFKVRPNRPTSQQLQFLRRKRRAGAIALVVYEPEDLFAALDMVLYGRVLPRGRKAA